MRQVITYNNKNWTLPAPNYLCFEAIEAGNVIFEAPNGFYTGWSEPNLEYSFDKSSWTTLHINETVNLSANDKIYFRGDNSNGWCYAKGPNWTVSTFYINCLHYTGRYNISGNIMTLIDKSGKTTTIPNTGCFCNIFCTELTSIGANNGKIVNAAKLSLPATTLTYNCYRNMFNGNQVMTYPPAILPAMTMAKQCYANMFLRCTALLESPILPATALSNECYRDMFNSCSSLRKITCYATRGIGSGTSKGTDNWCYGITRSDGTFYKARLANYPSGTSGIPRGWTVINL